MAAGSLKFQSAECYSSIFPNSNRQHCLYILEVQVKLCFPSVVLETSKSFKAQKTTERRMSRAAKEIGIVVLL